MSADDNMTDWAEGQPPPWLADYGSVVPPAETQPGIGLPTAAVDSAAQQLLQPPGVSAPPALATPPAQTQPGLGLPASAVDAAAQQLANPAAPPATTAPGAESRLGAPGFGPIPESAIPKPPSPQQPPWLQGPPDAISGVNASAPASEARNPTQDLARIAADKADSNAQIAIDPNADIADRQRAWQQLPPDMRASIVNGADPKQLAAVATAAMSPEDLATIQIRHEQAKVHEQVAQQLELSRKTAEEAQHNWEARQAAYQKANADTAQLEVEAKALSQQKIDPNEHGVGHFIASVLLSAIGGAMSQYTGGRNLALEELDKKTQARIDAQKADIANQWQGVNFKRNLIDEQYQRSGDLYRAQEAYRISQYDRAIGELQTKLQDYDPQGTTVLRGVQAVQQIQAQRAQALQAFAQQTFKNQIDAAKVDFDRIKAAQEAQQKAAELAQQERSSQRSAWVSTRGQDIGLQEHLLEAKDKAAEREDKRTDKLTTEDRELGLAIPGTGVLADPKSKTGVWHAPDKEEAGKVRKMVSTAADYNKLVNDMVRGIAEHGGESDYLKSDDWQRMQVKLHEATAALHEAYGIESFRENTVDFFEKMATAGVDPTSFVRDASAALRASNQDLQAKLNDRLTTDQYGGPPVSFADLSNIKPAGNIFGEETVLENAQGKEEGKVAGTIRKVPVLGTGGDPVANAENLDDQDAARVGKGTGLTIAQQGKIDSYVQQYKAGGKDGEAAATAIIDYVKEQRPSLRAGILSTLRGDAPQLWQQALHELPPDERKQQLATAKTFTEHSSNELLGDAAKNGDDMAMAEIARRAQAGDKGALAALTGEQPTKKKAEDKPKTSKPMQLTGPKPPVSTIGEYERTGGR